jgi:hypothetical protein
MRTFIGCVVIAASGIALAPSSQELHNLYGEPRVETLSARPGIDLTVEYGTDRSACQMLIEPSKSLYGNEEQGTPMSSASVSEILEEILPGVERGKHINRIVNMSGCNEAEILDYENVSIMRSKHTCDPLSQNQDVRTTIRFKREACSKKK